MLRHRRIIKLLSVLISALIFLQTSAAASSESSGLSQLINHGKHNIAMVTKQLIVQANDLVEHVVEDLLVLDSQNAKIQAYLNNFDGFLAGTAQGNDSETLLSTFYDIVAVYLDNRTIESASSIEIQLVRLCLRRHGFDRWRRTAHMRTNQLLKSFGSLLDHYLESISVSKELKQRWLRVIERGGQRKINKLHEFINWLEQLENLQNMT